MDGHDRKRAKKAKAVDSSEEEEEGIQTIILYNKYCFPFFFEDDDERLREELKDLIDDNPIEESDAESDASGKS